MRRLAAVFALLGTGLHAAPAAKVFEVSTVKPNTTNDNRVMLRIPPGGNFTATGVTLKLLLAEAYGVRDFQITGGPNWIDTDRWDIVAKAEGVVGQIPIEELRPMLRKLIEERFHLKVNVEQKETSVYALVVGKNGAKLRPTEVQPAPPQAAESGPPQDLKKGPQGPMLRFGRGEIIAKKITVKMLAQPLGQMLGRPVIDKTELTGEYDFDIKFTPEPGQGAFLPGGPPPGPEAAPPGDATGPSIFTALQEQLGLRLDSQKAPVETIVIEHVDKPTEN